MYSTSSLKQQSTYWHVAPLRHIILTPSQLVFKLTPSYCLVSREATYTNLIVIELTIDQTEDLPVDWTPKIVCFYIYNRFYSL
jgi:hypothetical protein